MSGTGRWVVRIVTTDGAVLAKRSRSRSVSWLRARQVRPQDRLVLHSRLVTVAQVLRAREPATLPSGLPYPSTAHYGIRSLWHRLRA